MNNNFYGKTFPLTSAQKYQKCVMESAGYTLDLLELDRYYRLPDDTDMEKLKEAVYDTIKSHPVYGIRLTDYDKPDMKVSDESPFVNIFELTEQEFSKFRESHFGKKRDLTKEPSINADIITSGSLKYLRLSATHLVYDQVTLWLLFNEISSRYSGDTDKIMPEDLTLFDIAASEASEQDSERCNKAVSYFDNLYGSLGNNSLFADNKCNSWIFGDVLTKMPLADMEKRIRELSASTGTFFAHAFEKTVKQFLSVDKFTYMVLSDGRNTDELKTVHGVLAKAVYVVSTDETADISECCMKIKQGIKDTLENDIVGFEKLINKYPNINSGITYNYVGKSAYDVKFLDKPIMHDFSAEHAKHLQAFAPLNFHIEKQDETLKLVLFSDRLDKASLEQFVKLFEDNVYTMLG